MYFSLYYMDLYWTRLNKLSRAIFDEKLFSTLFRGTVFVTFTSNPVQCMQNVVQIMLCSVLTNFVSLNQTQSNACQTLYKSCFLMSIFVTFYIETRQMHAKRCTNHVLFCRDNFCLIYIKPGPMHAKRDTNHVFFLGLSIFVSFT